MQQTSCHRIVRSDRREDHLTQQRFESYDAAYDELERYYGDFCCSDDERIEYTIVLEPSDSPNGMGVNQPSEWP